MSGFTKLFTSILASTIWREPDHVRVVWITMLAMVNRHGIVEASIPGLADMARVSVEQCENALEVLKGPDPYSRTKDHEGRRVEEVDGGFLLLNYAKHRSTMSQDDRRDYQRQYWHTRKQKHSTRNSTKLNSTQRTQDMQMADSDSDAFKKKAFRAPSIEEVKLQAVKIGLPEIEAQKFFDYYSAKGWTVGRSPMRSWPHAMSGWKNRWQEGTYDTNRPGSKPNPRNVGIATDPTEQARKIAEHVKRTSNPKPSA